MTNEEEDIIKKVFKDMQETIADAIIKPLESSKPKYKCPVCEGRGQVPPSFYYSYENPTTTNSGGLIFPVICRSCNGSGLV